jgi:glycosyltransferase involved in cell wall biosynthesis
MFDSCHHFTSFPVSSVVHHQRLPAQGQISIERLFEGVRQEFSEDWQIEVCVSPHPSHGVQARVRNLMAAAKRKADIHHIVGDVHYLALGLPGKKVMLTIHDCAVLERVKSCQRELLRQLWFVQPMRRAAVVTTISETTKQQLRGWVGTLADKVVVVPNCVRAEFQPDPKPFNTECPVVLQVGTGWNKNVVGVARALIGLPCRFEIVGQLDNCQRAAIDATGVRYSELGWISDGDLLEAYHRCDLLIFASYYEGFGLPIIEAQAIGRPVVTSSLSSMPEVAGEGALFVDPGSTISIRGAVNSLLCDERLRTSLVEKGYQNVERFRSNVIAQKYVALYERILQSSD